MPRKAKELSPIQVRRLTKPGFYSVGGVAGLHLRVIESGARSWILRLLIGGKRRDVGLGGFPDTTLEQARAKARDVRSLREQGIDPVADRQAARERLYAEQRKRLTFREAVKQFLASKRSEWKNGKHYQQWRNTLDTYADPIIGGIAVSDIEIAHVVRVLEPIWESKTETATRVRQRMEAVLDWCRVRGYREGTNPARWKGNLDHVLAKPAKLKNVKHMRALPVKELPAFMKALRKREGMAASALELLILTAARSGEIRSATWDEIDLKAKLWTVPASRMKAGKAHRVPLSAPAMKLLKELPKIKGTELVFPGSKGQPLSDMSLLAVCKRMEVDAVPHGFRSTFKDWARSSTTYADEVSELALAHVSTDATRAAYARDELLEARAQLMRDWAKYCLG